MKKTSKILVALCIMMMIISISVVSFGADEKAGKIDTILNGLNGNADVSTTNIMNLGNSIVTVVQVAGIVIAVVILLILGIKYMMGSAEEKADYKKSMIPYIVGAVIIFGATSIVKVVYDIASAVTTTGTTGTTGQ